MFFRRILKWVMRLSKKDKCAKVNSLIWNEMDNYIRKKLRNRIQDITSSVTSQVNLIHEFMKGPPRVKYPISEQITFEFYVSLKIFKIETNKEAWDQISLENQEFKINRNKKPNPIKRETNFEGQKQKFVEKIKKIINEKRKSKDELILNGPQFCQKMRNTISKLREFEQEKQVQRSFDFPKSLFSLKNLIRLNPFEKFEELMFDSLHFETGTTHGPSIYVLKNNLDSLETIDENQVNLSKYHSIFMRGNLLTIFQPVSPLNNLYEIDLSENRLVKFDLIFPSLKILNISKNQITNFNVAFVANELRNLNISYNLIVDMSELTKNASSLEELNVSHNKIEEIDVRDNCHLKLFNCSFNKIKRVRGLQRLFNVQQINICHNEFVSFKKNLVFPFLENFECDNFSKSEFSIEIYCMQGFQENKVCRSTVVFKPFCLLNLEKKLVTNFCQKALLKNYEIKTAAEISNRFSSYFYISPISYLEICKKVNETLGKNDFKKRIAVLMEKNNFEKNAKQKFEILRKLLKNKIEVFRKKNKIKDSNKLIMPQFLQKLTHILEIKKVRRFFLSFFQFSILLEKKARIIQKGLKAFLSNKKIKKLKIQMEVDKIKQNRLLFSELENIPEAEADFFQNSDTFEKFQNGIFAFDDEFIHKEENPDLISNKSDDHIFDYAYTENDSVSTKKNHEKTKVFNSEQNIICVDEKESPMIKMKNSKIMINSFVKLSPEPLTGDSKINNMSKIGKNGSNKNGKVSLEDAGID